MATVKPAAAAAAAVAAPKPTAVQVTPFGGDIGLSLTARGNTVTIQGEAWTNPLPGLPGGGFGGAGVRFEGQQVDINLHPDMTAREVMQAIAGELPRGYTLDVSKNTETEVKFRVMKGFTGPSTVQQMNAAFETAAKKDSVSKEKLSVKELKGVVTLALADDGVMDAAEQRALRAGYVEARDAGRVSVATMRAYAKLQEKYDLPNEFVLG
ncbi:MAG: hypothetical protein K1X89_25110 [Myxococcaceae bacterium]|nr:hypothetical protein [Myxococcaceae bacterium]